MLQMKKKKLALKAECGQRKAFMFNTDPIAVKIFFETWSAVDVWPLPPPVFKLSLINGLLRSVIKPTRQRNIKISAHLLPQYYPLPSTCLSLIASATPALLPRSPAKAPVGVLAFDHQPG